jgi:VIT1/CCC1 family predicted Fe2+/Mn2+ transporter
MSFRLAVTGIQVLKSLKSGSQIESFGDDSPNTKIDYGKPMSQHATHKSAQTGWLRAAVLGANDGIVSTASLVIGVAAANSSFDAVLLSGVAGLVAGAMSMAAGEYVSVSSQSDTVNADLAAEQKSLDENFEYELEELAKIYESRGLDPALSIQVAESLMAHDALGAHARDEIGISDNIKVKPVEAALSSAAAFTVGALLPLISAWLSPLHLLISSVAISSLTFLAGLGGLAAYMGGASIIRGAVRVLFWGALAMGLTAVIGVIFGVTS